MVPATTCGQNSRTNAVKTHEQNHVQNVQIWARPLHIAGRAIGGQIGGYARGYHDLFALLAPW